MIVAIDGPAGAGKSTLAKAIAEHLGFLHIDSGAMYRAVALAALDRGITPDKRLEISHLAAQISIFLEAGKVLLDGQDVTKRIRTPEIAAAASQVAAIPGVREALRNKQRDYASAGNVVMDGRDIGTEIFPEAELKLYLDANVDERASRRLHDIQNLGRDASIEDVKREMQERDERDSKRDVAPLRQAQDAVYLDTSGMSVQQVVELVEQLIAERTGRVAFAGKDPA